jgi:hypothetical protein
MSQNVMPKMVKEQLGYDTVKEFLKHVTLPMVFADIDERLKLNWPGTGFSQLILGDKYVAPSAASVSL